MAVEALFEISEPGQSRIKEACKGRAIGIDLGTTNSLVAAVQAGQPVCLTDSEALPEAPADAILPSVVYYGANGEVIVGADARDRLAPLFPRDTIASVKRFMGRGPGDAEATRRLTPYTFAPSQAGDPLVRFSVAGGARAVTPIEVSGEILKALRARAEDQLGGELAGAVITVPAYFDDAQRQATRTPAGWPASRCCASSTSRRRRRSPTGSTRGRRGPSRSTISAAAPSTSRSSSWRRACSR